MTDDPSTRKPGTPLIAAQGVSKSFPGVRALADADFAVHAGRLHALLGENGAGKSTLMNLLAGVFRPDAGEILVRGEPVVFRTPRDAQDAGVSMIYQELNLHQNLTVAENIFLGREPTGALGLVDYGAMHRRAAELLHELELEVDPRTPLSRLRLAEQQVVEIAKALSLDARVLIMDEPTSALTEQEVAALFRLIRRCKARGVGLVYITHRLDELEHVADDVTVLRDGRVVAAMPYGRSNRDELIRLMVGRELAADSQQPTTATDEVALRVERLSLQHPDRPRDFVVKEASFSVRRGEVLGLFGLMGAGRTELLQTIFGLHGRASSGEAWVAERRLSLQNPQEAIAAGVALAPEDRKAEGLVLQLSVAENTSLACLDKVKRWGGVSPARERRLAQKYVDRLRVKTPSLGQAVRNLSGGNQQKVVLAKWLATESRVLLLDEPTRGVDVGAKQEIHALIRELARGGLAVVMASSEMPEILAVADRILVLSEGRVTAEFARGEATEELLLRAALPQQRATA
jgi:ribose transport system ATP-binding protein